MITQKKQNDSNEDMGMTDKLIFKAKLGSKARMIVVIPTYNEIDNVPILIDKFKQVIKHSQMEILLLFVDDSSPDGTGKEIEKISKDLEYIGLRTRTEKNGLGMAYLDGFESAINEGADYIVQMDADLSHDPTLVLEFQNKISEGFDVVIASRYIKGGGVVGWPLKRKITSRGGNLYAKIMVRLDNVKDCTSGYRAINSKFVREILKKKNKFSGGYVFQIELLSQFITAGARVQEVPMIFKEREHGHSKLGSVQIIEFIRKLFLYRLLSNKV
tara:strand:- start:79 stop:894 length:816 start_codon:yes stop_codon:yes gene_type:complete